MTQVKFYALSSPDQKSRREFACRLAEKAAHLGHCVFIQVDSAEQAGAMDALLWRFKPSSFVPHSLAESHSSSPVVIGTAARQADYEDVFINLSAHPCQNLARYRRVNEILSNDPVDLQAGRQSYRFYQQQGFQPDTHKL